jgi:carboxypeptidase Taq
LEQALLEGEVTCDALPEVWNGSMRQYLGVTPPNDAEGVLQDIHWSSGYLGYFATYTLGNVLAAQFFAQARRELPGLEAQIAQGQFAGLLRWLQEKIYRHGRKFTLHELAQRVTGGPLSPGPYLAYLREKYGQIYGLSEFAG